MKNRKLLLIVSIVLALTMSLGGTLAYLTDTDADVNTMVLGNVKIVQNEQQRVEIGNAGAGLEPFEDGQVLLPAVYELVDAEGNKIDDPAREVVNVNGYKITYGGGMRTFPNYMDKIVTVTNTGTTDAYVRTIVAIPSGLKAFGGNNDDGDDGSVAQQWLHYNFVCDTDTEPANGWYYGDSLADGEYPELKDHFAVKGVELFNDGKLYDIAIVTNSKPVASQTTTGPNLVGLYLDNDVDYKEDGYYAKDPDSGEYVKVWEGTELKVYVLSQAVQSNGFEDPFVAFANAFPLGEDKEATLINWFNGWTKDDIGSPGDKNDTNNPPVPFAAVTTLGEDATLTNKDGDVTVLAENRTIDTTGSKMGLDAGVIPLDVAYQFEPTMTLAEAEESEYRYWHADFVVSVNKDVPAYSIGLAGYYDAWCSLNNDKWVLLASPDTITAGTEIRLVETMGGGSITVNYEELCDYGNDGIGFLCGAVDMGGMTIDGATAEALPAGTVLSVELRLYETEEPSEANGNSHNVETGKYVTAGVYTYTFE